jgi:hypothetical protein
MIPQAAKKKLHELALAGITGTLRYAFSGREFCSRNTTTIR